MSQLRSLFLSRNWQAVTTHLSHLSNADFRRAEKTVRETILPDLPSDIYWEALLHLIIFKKAAFITGILALDHIIKRDEPTLTSDGAKAFASYLTSHHPDSVPKIINMALPLLHSEQQMHDLFATFCIDDPRQRTAHLLKVESPTAYFMLFKTLKFMPDSQELVRRCCIYIMRRNNDQAFNMVSILRAYFGIDDIKSQLSLHIDTYELNYLDRNFDTFLHMLNGKRPKL